MEPLPEIPLTKRGNKNERHAKSCERFNLTASAKRALSSVLSNRRHKKEPVNCHELDLGFGFYALVLIWYYKRICWKHKDVETVNFMAISKFTINISYRILVKIIRFQRSLDKIKRAKGHLESRPKFKLNLVLRVSKLGRKEGQSDSLWPRISEFTPICGHLAAFRTFRIIRFHNAQRLTHLYFAICHIFSLRFFVNFRILSLLELG